MSTFITVSIFVLIVGIICPVNFGLQCYNCRGITNYDPNECFIPVAGKTVFQECQKGEVCETVHTTERCYQCIMCNKAFKWARNLCEHNDIHRGFRPFVCAVFGKAFVGSSKLQLHNKTHTGERTYQCNSCDKDFKRLSELRVHKTTHITEGSYKFDTHISFHSGVRPYVCVACGKAFITDSKL